MTQHFTVGHNPGEGETLSIARQWKDTRGNDPGGGIASSSRTSFAGPGSTSATAARKAVPEFYPPRCCTG